MASYYVIGGDTKEYGPIWQEDIRSWIAESRLNGQSLAKAEGETAWRTLGSFPEFAETLKLAAPLTIAPPPVPGTGGGGPASMGFLERDYDLDIGGCVSRGWEILKNNFGTVFPAFLAMAAIVFAVSMVLGLIASLGLKSHVPVVRAVTHLLSSLALAPVLGPMMGGLYLLVLRINRGETATVGDVFAGFQRNFKDLLLGQMAVSLAVGLCMAPYLWVNDARLQPIMEQIRQASQHSPQDVQNLIPQMWSAIFAMLPVMLVCMIPVTYLSVNWQFTLPLIIDKRMAFWPAMKASWTMVHKHWWYVFGLSIVVGLVMAAGVLGCCIGVIVTIPIGLCAVMIAYETIFGSEKN